jgi:hypothetical protein
MIVCVSYYSKLQRRLVFSASPLFSSDLWLQPRDARENEKEPVGSREIRMVKTVQNNLNSASNIS